MPCVVLATPLESILIKKNLKKICTLVHEFVWKLIGERYMEAISISVDKLVACSTIGL
jgi:hypothetical protein